MLDPAAGSRQELFQMVTIPGHGGSFVAWCERDGVVDPVERSQRVGPLLPPAEPEVERCECGRKLQNRSMTDAAGVYRVTANCDACGPVRLVSSRLTDQPGNMYGGQRAPERWGGNGHRERPRGRTEADVVYAVRPPKPPAGPKITFIDPPPQR
jgi:hypothetical protein